MANKKTAKARSIKKTKSKTTASKSSAKKSSKATGKSRRTSSANKIEVKQSSKYCGNDWWEWSVWIEASTTVLNSIEYVEYKLHPTFTDRIQRRTNRDEKFRLDSSGWGEFMIDIEVGQQDGSKFITRHWLTLEYPSESATRGLTSTPLKEKEGRRPTVFLSSGVSDLRMGNALSEALKQQGLKVLKPDESPIGLPWDVAIGGMIKAADLMVMLISGGLTSWAMREIEAAKNRELPIVPIIIGSVSELPEDIEKLQHINLKDAKEPDKIAPNIASQITRAIKVLPPKTAG
jgi:YEATS family/TIR domain